MDSSRPGEALQGEARRLLELAGLRVLGESLVAYKKVDLIATDLRLGRTHRLAVECKDWADPLNQSDVTMIYANYKPLCEERHIDGVLLVTRNGLTPTAARFVDAARDFSHQTVADLYFNVMDFRSYLNGLVDGYRSDALSKYYIPVKLKSGDDLEMMVTDWVDGPVASPLALLGSYGLGKTSFARYICHKLAMAALESPSHARWPVYVKLGEIGAEQSLEGLLGKLLTATTHVSNYSFGLFLRLNELGRFVIVLDGFDEMKHTLSWEEFRYNFKQLNRLVSGNSRVLLLGRPTAFLSDEEQRSVLRGVRNIRGVEFRDPDWPEYLELELAPFDRVQVAEYLNRYWASKLEQSTEAERRSYRHLLGRVDEISGKDLADVARRPVQLRMLAELLPQWDGPLERITLTVLYSMFIDLIIEREQGKLARTSYNKAQRRDFARAVAWWLWESPGKSMGARAEEIPDEVLEPFVTEVIDTEAARRDLVSACFLDRKVGDVLFFPHRSFQEYLVAEWLVNALCARRMTLAECDRIMTTEVGFFMHEQIGVKELQALEPALLAHRGILSHSLADAWARGGDRGQFLERRLASTRSPWYALLYTAWALAGEGSRSDVLDDLVREAADARDARLVSLLLICALALVTGGGAPQENKATERAVEIVVEHAIRVAVGVKPMGTAAGLERALFALMAARGARESDRKRRAKEERRRTVKRTKRGARKDGDDEAEAARAEEERGKRVLVKALSRMVVNEKREVLEIAGAYRVFATELAGYCAIREWLVGPTIRIGLESPVAAVRVVSSTKDYRVVLAELAELDAALDQEERSHHVALKKREEASQATRRLPDRSS